MASTSSARSVELARAAAMQPTRRTPASRERVAFIGWSAAMSFLGHGAKRLDRSDQDLALGHVDVVEALAVPPEVVRGDGGHRRESLLEVISVLAYAEAHLPQEFVLLLLHERLVVEGRKHHEIAVLLELVLHVGLVMAHRTAVHRGVYLDPPRVIAEERRRLQVP